MLQTEEREQSALRYPVALRCCVYLLREVFFFFHYCGSVFAPSWEFSGGYKQMDEQGKIVFEFDRIEADLCGFKIPLPKFGSDAGFVEVQVRGEDAGMLQAIVLSPSTAKTSCLKMQLSVQEGSYSNEDNVLLRGVVVLIPCRSVSTSGEDNAKYSSTW